MLDLDRIHGFIASNALTSSVSLAITCLIAGRW